MKKLKKPVSILLSLVMVISLFSIVPVTAFAADEPYTIDANGKLTLHAGTFTDPFTLFESEERIKSVYAEPGVVLSGDCHEMFSWCLNIKSIDLSNADMSGVTSVEKFFEQCYQCKTIELPKSNVSFGTGTAGMFYNCNQLEELDLSGCDTSNVITMSEMFSHCRSIKNLDLKSFNTSSVKNMQKMFYDCTALENVDLSTFDTKKVTNMESMFSDCPSIKTLDLSSFDTSMVGTFDYMFCNTSEGNDYQLTTIYVSDNWNVESSTGQMMFRNCVNLIGGQGTTYAWKDDEPDRGVGIKYAHIDGGENDKGYLTRLDKEGVFAGKTLTLNGNIAVNFFIDPTPAGVTVSDIQSGKKSLDIHFSWSTSPAPLTDLSEYDITIDKDNFNTYFDDDYGYFKVSCDIAAAEMSCVIKANALINGITAEKTYSVRDYGSTVLNPDSEFSNNYKSKYGELKYNKLVDLVKKMLDYGAKAQKVFNINIGDLANNIIPLYEMDNVSKEMCVEAVESANDGASASDMASAASDIQAEYYSTSLVYLSNCTLRHYFTFNTHPEAYNNVKDDLNSSKAPYYYVEHSDIPAAELDDLQTFTLDGQTYYYSALDFAGAMIQNAKASDDSKNLAMALYWYNQAANEFFE